MDEMGCGIINALTLGLESQNIAKFLINTAQLAHQKRLFLLLAFLPPFHYPVPFPRLFQSQPPQRLAAVYLAAQFLFPPEALSANHFKKQHIVPAEQLIQPVVIFRLRHMNSTNESYFHPIVMDIGSYGSGQALPVGRGRIQKHVPPGIPAIFRLLRGGNVRSRSGRTPPKDSQKTMQQFHTCSA